MTSTYHDKLDNLDQTMMWGSMVNAMTSDELINFCKNFNWIFKKKKNNMAQVFSQNSYQVIFDDETLPRMEKC